MHALKTIFPGLQSAAPYGAGAGQVRVLPRLLRKPARLAGRMLKGDVVFPRHAQGFISGGTIAAAILYGSIMGGQFSQAVGDITTVAGFSVSEIEISGNKHTGPADVYTALGLEGARSLITIDPATARDQLRALPWVDDAQIAKVYPSKLVVTIDEREAFAVWQQGEALTVIEHDGTVIGGFAADAQLAALPLVVGPGAAERGKEMVDLVAQFPEIAPRVRAYIRVGMRRWDVRLDNGITLRLPEVGVSEALERLVDLHAQHDVLGRDIAAIDLRLTDRTVFAMTENARTAREKFVKTRASVGKKKSGSRI